MTRRTSPQSEPTPSTWKRHGFCVAALLALVFIAFQPALTAGFIWDDPDYVINNRTLRTLDGLQRIWLVPGVVPQYYPLVHTTFWVEYQTWKLWAPGYHATNVILHVTASLLLWRLLRRLGVPGAWLGAALFAVHPVQVESVAWVTERKNVLSATFAFAAFIAYLRFDQEGASREARRGWYVAALLLFGCALLSKTVTCALPAAIVLVLWWKRGRLAWREVAALLPFFVLGAGLGLMTARLEREHVGALGADWDYSVAERFLIAGRALWFYTWKLVAPIRLSFVYEKWPIDADDWRQWFFPVLAAAVPLAALVMHRRWGRGPLVAALLFGGILLPALGFINLYPMRYTFVADHYQYHACAAALAAAAAGGVMLAQRLGWGMMAMRVATGVVLLVLAGMSHMRSRVYRDEETLWRDTITKNPNGYMPRANLGETLARQDRDIEALEHFRAAVQIAPDRADVNFRLGAGLSKLRRYDEAEASYRRALAIDPDFANARFGLGVIFLMRGDAAKAEPEIRRAIELKPKLPEAHYNLGIIAEGRGDRRSAIDHYQQAVVIWPEFVDARINLANALMAVGRWEEARVQYEEVLRYWPNFAPAALSMGEALYASGRVKEAVAAYRKALELDPTLVPARQALNRALASGGR